MPVSKPAFTVGIEEEYLVVDRESRDLMKSPPSGMWKGLTEILGEKVGPEFLKAQIEVGTQVATDLNGAMEDLRSMRLALDEVVTEYGGALVASSTHPSAEWWSQETTDQDRYRELASDLQQVARRLVICGMHVHVGIEDPDLRIDMMNQFKYFLPHVLALSTSSPFWTGRNTGLKCYRLSVFQTLPRTGIPEEFSSWREYERHVDILVGAGIIEDPTKLWWDIRPSHRYPTLEMRISDVATRLEDGITIAAFYLGILHMLYRMRLNNHRWRMYSPALISENVWRAQRYGHEATLIDFGRGELVPYGELIEELIEMTSIDAEILGISKHMEHARQIVAEGTSADRQLAAYEAAILAGANHSEALQNVVDHLMVDTLHGL
ncbi:MAG: carboxylate-amine ligase [Acidimicrobiia bacterium]|nr:carboxylate-amine ligase [Acidimicrobiia bacterium]